MLDEDSAGPLAELLTDSPVSLAASRTSDLPRNGTGNGNDHTNGGGPANDGLEQPVDLDPPTVRVQLDADAIRRIGRGAAPNAILSVVAGPNADDVGEEIDPFLAVEDEAVEESVGDPRVEGSMVDTPVPVDDLRTIEPPEIEAPTSEPETVSTAERLSDPSRDGYGRFDGGLAERFMIGQEPVPNGNGHSDDADGGTRFVERRKRPASGLWAELESLPGPDEESAAPATPVDGTDLPSALPPIDDVFGTDEAFGLRSGSNPTGAVPGDVDPFGPDETTGPPTVQLSTVEAAATADEEDGELEALFLPLEDEPGGIILADDLPDVDGVEPATVDLDLDLVDIGSAFEPTAGVDLAGGLRYSTESMRPGGLQWSTVVHEPAPTDHLGETLPQQASIVQGGGSEASTNLNRPPSQSRGLPSSVIDLVDRRGFWAAIAGAVAVSCGLIGFAAVGRGEETSEALPDAAAEQVQTETAEIDPDPAGPDATDPGVTTTAISPSVASSAGTIGSDTTAAPETEAAAGAGGGSDSGGGSNSGGGSGGGETSAGDESASGGSPSTAPVTSTPTSAAATAAPATPGESTETTRRTTTTRRAITTTRRTTTTRRATTTTRRTTTTVRPTSTLRPTTTVRPTTTIRVTSTTLTTRPTTEATTTTTEAEATTTEAEATTTEAETTTTEVETTTTEAETTTTEVETTTTEAETTTTENEQTNNSTVGSGQGQGQGEGQGQGDGAADPNGGPPGSRDAANPETDPADPNQDPANPGQDPTGTTTSGPVDPAEPDPVDPTQPTLPDPDAPDPDDTVPRPGEPR